MPVVLPREMILFRRFLDEQAPMVLDQLIPQLASSFLDDTVLGVHEVHGRVVRMRDHVNLVITAELPGRKLLGFIAAEVNPENDRAVLHVIYVLRGMRRLGAATLLLERYEETLRAVGCTSCKVVPLTHRSCAIFGARKNLNVVAWELLPPGDDDLRRGDREIADD